jgi:hypothetical protein
MHKVLVDDDECAQDCRVCRKAVKFAATDNHQHKLNGGDSDYGGAHSAE